MSAKQLTPRQKFIRYLEKMLHWQRLPRDSAEQHKAMREWLEQGQHQGGKALVPESSTDEGQRIKDKRDGWKHEWQERIQDDPDLLAKTDEAGVLDKPRPDAMPGDFANPDPRVYKAITIARPSPKAEELPASINQDAWKFFKNRK